MVRHKFNPATDIPDLAGKVYLITGANSGLGEAAVTALAQHNPGKIYLAARSQSRAEQALTRIRQTSKAAESANIEILNLDLSSLESVKTAAAKVNAETDRLDQLQLNGGIAALQHDVSKDGYELTFATNYLGHALLTQLLMPKLLATSKLSCGGGDTPDVRIVCMSSVGHKLGAPKQGIHFDELRSKNESIGAMTLYGQSNIARTLFALQLSKRYPQLTSTSMHPGTVLSNIWNGDKAINWYLWKFIVGPLVWVTGVTTTEGAKNQLWCGFADKKSIDNGAYYEPIGKRADGKFTRDEALAEKLWDWTEAELAKHGGPGWAVAS